MAGGAEIMNTGVCMCRLNRLKRNVGFWIALNNFSCPQDVCPWRFQVIADGCVKDQYCCSNHWEGQEIAYFPYTEHVSTVYLQISQLANPPIDILTLYVSIMIEEENQLSENGAQLTCGIAADKSHEYNFARCGRMPDLKHATKSSVPLKKRAAGDVVDLCTLKEVTENPVTFYMNLVADYGDKICNARISSNPGSNTYTYMVEKFLCSDPCAYRLIIIVGKCSKHYICCGASWKAVTKMIANVKGDSYIRVQKYGNQPVSLDFKMSMVIKDNSGRKSQDVRSLAGSQVSRLDQCFPNTCLEVTRNIKACANMSLNPPSGSTSNATPINTTIESKPFDSMWILMSLATSGYVVGASVSIPIVKCLMDQCGFAFNAIIVNSLAAYVQPYATANGGSLVGRMFNMMQRAANVGFSVVDILAMLAIGGTYGAAATLVVAFPLIFFLG